MKTEGKVLAVSGGIYRVLTSQKTIVACKPRGIFRHQNKKPLVGDQVILDDENMIAQIKERKNVLMRPMIANLDFAFVVTSLKEPDFSSLLLDKFLSMLSLNNVEAVIVLSKYDLVKEDTITPIIASYQALGYKVIRYSKKTQEGLKEIKSLMKDKTVAFIGQTGVGKSSLINLIDPNYKRTVGEYSLVLGRGKHQTKEVVIFPYGEGYLADTPGFSSLELQCFKEDLARHFPSFSHYVNECYFTDCLHQNEKNCKVKEHLQSGKISKEHYQNYLTLLKDLPYRKDRYQ